MDKARAWSDKHLAKMEKRLKNIYVKSYNEMTDKWMAYMKRSNARLNSLQNDYEKALQTGTKEEIVKANQKLIDAKKAQTFQSQYYRDMVNQTATNIANVNQIAIAYVNGELPKIASVNYNELRWNADKVGMAFNLVDEHTVMLRMKENNIKLPYKELDPAKDIPWNTRKLNSAVLQGIVQGESMNKIAERILPIVHSNETASIRTARTCVTGAENAGRQASYKELESKGAEMKKVWIATSDGRTREFHLEMDGQEVDIDDVFIDGRGNELEYPGDPSAAGETVYNCRCSMRSHIIGFRRADGSIKRIDYDRDVTGHSKEIAKEKKVRAEAKKEKEIKRQKEKPSIAKEKRGQIDTGIKGNVGSADIEQYNENAKNQIMKDTGYSEEQAIELQENLQEYLGGDYASFVAGEQAEKVKIIDAGIDKMPAYDGKIYRGMSFKNEKDLQQFLEVEKGDALKMKSISSWSSNQGVASSYGQRLEAINTVMLECEDNITSVGVQHISKWGTSEAEVLAKSTTQWEIVEVKIESKYDVIVKDLTDKIEKETRIPKKNLLKDTLSNVEKEKEKYQKCKFVKIKVKEMP